MTQSTSADFLQALQRKGLIFDGAMGTSLYERGLLYTSCLDAAVLQQPSLVQSVHQGFIRAGAQVLQTNTFGANRIRLQTYGLQDKVAEINRRAVAIARETSSSAHYVLGSMGPTGVMLETADERLCQRTHDAFKEQAEALVAAGVDAIMLETLQQRREMELAVAALRQVTSSLPFCVSLSFRTEGTLSDGSTPEAIAELLCDLDVPAIGVNCGDGPAKAYDVAMRMLTYGLPLIVRPNAGLPRRIEGRLAYMATPDYFQLYARRLFKAGVHAVGGCCGTTPDHIKAIAKLADGYSPRRSHIESKEAVLA